VQVMGEGDRFQRLMTESVIVALPAVVLMPH
jgi:hypothetical protein